MTQQGDVEIIYADLIASFAALNAARPSPVQVRRRFGEFVVCGRRLTTAMCRELKRRTGVKWQAHQLPGWHPVGELFWLLRNVGEYEFSLALRVRERQSYRPVEGNPALLVFEGTWEPDDQLSEKPPQGLRLVPADPRTGKPTESIRPPASAEHFFLIHPRNNKVRELLKDALKTCDVHELSGKYLAVLEAYLAFYREQLANAIAADAVEGLTPE